MSSSRPQPPRRARRRWRGRATRKSPYAWIISSGGQLAQNILQDAAVEEIFQLVDGVDPATGQEGLGRAVGAGEDHLDILARADLRDVLDGEALRSVQAERLARDAFGELKRQHTHADQVRAVD